MFRRRPFRRLPLVRRRRPPPSPGAPPHRPPLPPRVLQALARANRLVADEQFVEAAKVYGATRPYRHPKSAPPCQPAAVAAARR